MCNDIRSDPCDAARLRQVNGFSKDHALTIESVRGRGFDSVRDVCCARTCRHPVLERLPKPMRFVRSGSTGATRSGPCALAAQRRQGRPALVCTRPPCRNSSPTRRCRRCCRGEQVVADYRHLRLSLKAHPVSFIAANSNRRGILPNEELTAMAFQDAG